MQKTKTSMKVACHQADELYRTLSVITSLVSINKEHGGYIKEVAKNGARAVAVQTTGENTQRGGYHIKKTAEEQHLKMEKWHHTVLGPDFKATILQKSIDQHSGALMDEESDGDH